MKKKAQLVHDKSEFVPYFPNAHIVIGEAELALWMADKPDLCCFLLGTPWEAMRDNIAQGVKAVLAAQDQSKFRTVSAAKEEVFFFYYYYIYSI